MNDRAKTYLLIVAFGFVGAILRYLVEAVCGGTGFPFATLGINLVGCFCIEIVNDFVGRRLHLRSGTVRAMGTGLVGAFTTLSAFTNETVSLLAQGQTALALCYIACTWIGCFLAALAGHYVTRGLAAMRLRRTIRARNARRGTDGRGGHGGRR